MAIYLVGYDLHEGQDYEDLINALKSYGAWWHHLDSTWLIKTQESAIDIRNKLKKHIKSDDELLVIKYGNEAAWFGFNEKGAEWLKDNLS
jgi:hypothetical protein